MKSIVVNPKDQNELEFIAQLLRKLGVESKVISVEEMEDIGLALLMKDVDTSDVVTEEEIMSKLKG